MTDWDDALRLAAEQRARVPIDRQLIASGWVLQDKRDLNLFAAQGVAVRESIMAPGHGRADYLLYVEKRAVGVIEAKPEGSPLSGVEWQSAMYAEGLPADVRLKALTMDGRSMEVAVPSRGFQSAAIARITELNDARDQLSRGLTLATTRGAALRRSLLAAAFSGRVTRGETDLSVATEIVIGA